MSDAIHDAIEITCCDLLALLEEGASVMLVDCRMPQEYDLAHLPGAQLVPMESIPDHVTSLRDDPSMHIVVYCHHGVRSLQVTTYLRQAGLRHARSLRGGIDQWSLEIDPDVPRYGPEDLVL